MAIKFLNTVAVDTDVLYVDASSNKVGIGTTSPSQALEVNGNIQATGTRSISSLFDANHYMRLESNSSGGILKGADGGVTTTLVRTYGDSYFNGGNVGIGTTSPSQRTVISGPSTNPLLNTTVPSSATLLLSNSDTAYGTYFCSLGTGTGLIQQRRQTSAVYYDLAINPYGGNVGIGTTSPNSKLQVNVGTDQNIGFNSDSSVARISSYNDAFSASSPLKINGSDLRFDISTVEKMRITSDGNVGIGTTSPNNFGFLEKVLNISAGSSSSTTLQQAGIVVSSSSDADDADDFGYLSFTNYQSSTSNGRVAEIRALKNGTNVDTGEFAFYTSSGSGPAERMRITSAGNVGIGTASPDRKLTVNGSANVFDSLLVNSNTPTTGTTTDAELVIQAKGNQAGTIRSSQWYFQTIPDSIYGNSAFRIAKNYDGGATSEFMRINSSGNVGIGTTNPSEKLEVAGNARITGDVTLSNGNALRWTSDDVRIEGTTAGDNIKFYVANTEILQLAQSGTLATVTGNLRVTGAYYDSNNSAGTSGQVLSSTATGTDWVSLSDISGVDGTGTTNYVAKWSDSDTITDSVIYDNGTNVGIGTTSPDSILHVKNGDAGVTPYSLGTGLNIEGTTSTVGINIISSDTAQGRIYFASPSSNTAGAIEYNHNASLSSGFMKFRTGNSERMRITGDGNVGIGTTSPNYKLAVYGSSTDSEIVASFGSANDVYEYTAIGLSGFIASNGATKAGLALKRTSTYGTGELHFLNNNTLDNSDMNLSDSKMMINSSGNVGIGTTSPQSKLQVAGGVQMADDTDAASADKVGTLRYRTSGNNSYVDMCMQTGATTYEWVNIVQNNW